MLTNTFTLKSGHVLFCFCTEVDGQNGSASDVVTAGPVSHQSQTGSYVMKNLLVIKCYLLIS